MRASNPKQPIFLLQSVKSEPFGNSLNGRNADGISYQLQMQAGIWDATFSKVDKSKGGFRAERQLLIPQGLRTVSLFASCPILCNRIGWLCWELVKRNPKLDALAIMSRN